MGVLSNLFIATDEDVRGSDAPPFERFPYLDIKGMTEIERATLNAQIRDLEFEDALDDFEGFHAIDETEGPWVLKLTDALVQALANLSDVSLEAHARQWATSEELEDWDVADVRERLEGIVSLAREAVTKYKSVFLWNSL